MNVLTPVAIRLGGLSWLPRFLRQITAIDKFLQRITKGQWSLLRIAGLPSMMLTVMGRKSGVARSTPVLCVPYRDGQLVAGSNFGGQKAPIWVLNVRAADRVTVTVDGRTYDAVPRELTGDERAAAWTHMLETWPNYAKYEARTDRVIPVFLFTPA
ncbi:MAG: nitroreductase family deazaflavin-dependent oxidoreductase [Propionibacteriales bacterium]|nr:nitroreductase family deazaflavin-dependent oxidoreductase [Propionibacteriales bacterium]